MKKIFRALASISAGLSLTVASSHALAVIQLDGKSIEVVDLHLHPGFFGHIASGGKSFLIKSTPEFTQIYAPAVFARTLDPYAEHVGIKAQTNVAGVDHAVLYAVYTHKTTGYFTNEELETALSDARNVAADKKPWAWGFASINFFDGYEEPTVSKQRLGALSSYFEKRPDLFIGIKLAHAHQAVAFDDPKFLGVYDVAAKFGVPVLLHTGFSPFPNSQTDPKYYDPVFLESVVTNYDGAHGNGRVNFVLSHVGQGDERAVKHVLELAQKHDNVHLEISALNRPFLIDASGNTVNQSEPQYPFVLQEIKKRGLVGRALFGTDGPQFSGFVTKYVGLMVNGMKDAGYTTDEITAVLSGNFYSLFFGKGT